MVALLITNWLLSVLLVLATASLVSFFFAVWFATFWTDCYVVCCVFSVTVSFAVLASLSSLFDSTCASLWPLSFGEGGLTSLMLRSTWVSEDSFDGVVTFVVDYAVLTVSLLPLEAFLPSLFWFASGVFYSLSLFFCSSAEELSCVRLFY